MCSDTAARAASKPIFPYRTIPHRAKIDSTPNPSERKQIILTDICCLFLFFFGTETRSKKLFILYIKKAVVSITVMIVNLNLRFLFICSHDSIKFNLGVGLVLSIYNFCLNFVARAVRVVWLLDISLKNDARIR